MQITMHFACQPWGMPIAALSVRHGPWLGRSSAWLGLSAGNLTHSGSACVHYRWWLITYSDQPRRHTAQGSTGYHRLHRPELSEEPVAFYFSHQSEVVQVLDGGNHTHIELSCHSSYSREFSYRIRRVSYCPFD